MRSVTAVGLIASLALAGCGGGSATSQTPAQQVRQVADQFSAAFGSGNIKKACALFDPAGWSPPPNDCVGIYGGGSAFERTFLTAKVARVVVTGSTATVGFSNQEIIRFKKLNGRWMVEDLGGTQNSTSRPSYLP